MNMYFKKENVEINYKRKNCLEFHLLTNAYEGDAKKTVLPGIMNIL